MKHFGLFLIVILSVLLVAAVAFKLFYHPSQKVNLTIPPSVATSSPNPSIDEIGNLKSALQTAIAAKNHVSPDSFIISISQISGNFAKGSVNPPTPGPGGGLFFAAKVNGLWKLVWDGNGIVTCDDLKSYPDFPASLIPQCFATSSGQMITR